jgi:hypothetical protein
MARKHRCTASCNRSARRTTQETQAVTEHAHTAVGHYLCAALPGRRPAAAAAAVAAHCCSYACCHHAGVHPPGGLFMYKHHTSSLLSMRPALLYIC